MLSSSRGIQISIPLTEVEAYVLLTALVIFLGVSFVFIFFLNGLDLEPASKRTSLDLLKTFSFMLFPIWLVLLGVMLVGLWQLTSGLNLIETDEDARWYGIGVVGHVTALIALASVPLALIRVYTTERQTRTAEQGHMTDRISKAVEHLGAEKLSKTIFETPRFKKMNGEWETDKEGQLKPALRPDGSPIVERDSFEETVPNIEVRIGGIYALERIAQDSITNDHGRDHIRVMEILSIYIRENAPIDRKNGGLEISVTRELLKTIEPPRVDIRVAIEVIARRNPAQQKHEKENGFCINLRGVNLRKMELTEPDFRNVDLSGVRFDGATLEGAKFDGAKLVQARGRYSVMFGASFKDADMTNCHFQSALLSGVIFDGANIFKGRFIDAELLENPNVAEGPASFFGANICEVDFDRRDGFLRSKAVVDQRFKKSDEMMFLNSFSSDRTVLQSGSCFETPTDIVRDRYGPTYKTDVILAWKKWQRDIGYRAL